MRTGDGDAAAEFISAYGPLIRRRVGGKMDGKFRRLFDSQELLSTVGRRLDRYVLSGRIRAETTLQLFILVFRMADAAMVDKARIMRRVDLTESEDSPFACALRRRILDAERSGPDGAENQIDAAFRSLPNALDREILALWLHGKQHIVIAGEVGLTPDAVRKRWQAIREKLRVHLEGAA